MDDKTLDVDSLVVLLDNGSLSPESVLQAREVASALSKRIDRPVESVSVLHSARIPAESVGGACAKTWKPYLDECIESRVRSLIVLPLFFGRSDGLRTAERVAASELSANPSLQIHWAERLVAESRDRLPQMMVDDINRILDTNEVSGFRDGDTRPATVLLVDHGSPYSDVADCRNAMASALTERLGGRVKPVIACSMERREGGSYVFNEPLLETALEGLTPQGSETLVLSQLFLFAGRHAGPGGDIENICQNSRWVRNGGRIARTPLLGSNPRLVDLLEARWKAVSTHS